MNHIHTVGIALAVTSEQLNLLVALRRGEIKGWGVAANGALLAQLATLGLVTGGDTVTTAGRQVLTVTGMDSVCGT